ncbi:MAG: prepilin-type N-terminal cleavage/methylation domain-containing protein [Gaiellales bacterium]
MSASSPWHREAGFTVIEMIVALCIFAVLMGAALPALGNMLDMGNRGTANAQASADSSYALQTVEADLRRARANRGSGAFERGPSVTTALASASTAQHDIIEAGPTRLRVWTDALGSSPGAELVTYELREQATRSRTGPCDRIARRSWCILRTVQPAAGGTTLVEVLAHGTGAFPLDRACIPGSTTATRRLFCYQHKVPRAAGTLATRYTWNGWRPTCTSSWGAPPAPIVNWNTTASPSGRALNTWHDRIRSSRSSIWTLDTISAIGIVMPAGGRTDGARGMSTNITNVELRNRASEEYQTAIMCGAR